MQTLFVICSVAGGTVLVIQLLLLLVGFDSDGSGGDVDADVPADGDMDPGDYHVDSGEGASGEATSVSFQVISTKTLTAFFTFFGLGGLLGQSAELETTWTLVVAIGLGGVALLLVAYLWTLLNRLQSSGNIHFRNSVGTVGRVYLRIPAEGDGEGKVTITVQGRTMEVNAVTGGEELPTGRSVRVVGLVGPSTVKVVPVVEKKKE